MRRDLRPPGSGVPGEDGPPELAASVRFEPTDDGAHVLVCVEGVPVSRASASTVALLRAMDGRVSTAELRARFAADEPPETFDRLLDRFRDVGLLRGSPRRLAGRLVYRRPLTLQAATLRAPRLFATLDAALRPLLRRWLVWPVTLVTAVGLVALALQSGDAVRALTSPMPLTDLLAVAFVLVASTLVHELAHGLALTRQGGRPRRAGVMLLYLTPAFFVDVTDAWRLPGRRGRVVVALAGPAVHLVVVALCALGAAVVDDASVRRTLLVLACACAGVVLVNLVPFVRFDGYIALMSALDEPDLRGRTMRDAASAVRHRVFGAPAVPRSLARWWSVPFGVASVLAPAALVLTALARLIAGLSGAGPAGALVVLGVEAAVVAALVVAAARGLAGLIRAGVRRGRVVVVLTALIAGAALLGSAIVVPTARTVGFVTVEGTTLLVAPASGEPPTALPIGAAVSFSTPGVVADAPRGTGTVGAGGGQLIEVPLAAVAPIEVPGMTVPAVVLGSARVDPAAALPAAGRARVDLGSRSLWEAVWSAFVAGPASPLVPGGDDALTPAEPKER